MTFIEVLATNEPIGGVIVKDASTVLVASGAGGMHRSDDGGMPCGHKARDLGCFEVVGTSD